LQTAAQPVAGEEESIAWLPCIGGFRDLQQVGLAEALRQGVVMDLWDVGKGLANGRGFGFQAGCHRMLGGEHVPMLVAPEPGHGVSHVHEAIALAIQLGEGEGGAKALTGVAGPAHALDFGMRFTQESREGDLTMSSAVRYGRNGVDRQLRCGGTFRKTAQPVGDGIKTLFCIEQQGVFIRFPTTTRMADASNPKFLPHIFSQEQFVKMCKGNGFGFKVQFK